MKKIAIFSTFVLVCGLFSCTSGSAILTGQARPAISPENVKLYLTPPAEYESIGIVESSSEVGFSSQSAQDRTISELKAQAAKIGANGVLLSNTGEKSSGMSGFISGGFFYGAGSDYKTARGEAIFVKKE